MPTKRLEMVFKNALGRTNKITVDNVLDNLTEIEVQAAMQSIIDANIFDGSGGELVGIESARVVATDIEEVIA